ncbi:hypothetical protein AC249_AIPGENE18656 [Exaiptasia diaphana]|nr:hypothetical protein AC249_AIPGENE18656 [Exaiptasia diaphana]
MNTIKKSSPPPHPEDVMMDVIVMDEIYEIDNLLYQMSSHFIRKKASIQDKLREIQETLSRHGEFEHAHGDQLPFGSLLYSRRRCFSRQNPRCSTHGNGTGILEKRRRVSKDGRRRIHRVPTELGKECGIVPGSGEGQTLSDFGSDDVGDDKNAMPYATFFTIDMSPTREGEDNVNLFGLDRYQENVRVMGMLVTLSENLVRWNQELQRLSTRASCESLGFYDLDTLVKMVMLDMNGVLCQVLKEKRKFGEECKKARDSIKAVSDLGPYSNPEPDASVTQEVLQEGSNRKRSKKEQKEKLKKKRKSLPPLRLKVVESAAAAPVDSVEVDRKATTPEVHTDQDDLLGQYLKEHPLP